jgi:hypothetical protein
MSGWALCRVTRHRRTPPLLLRWSQEVGIRLEVGVEPADPPVPVTVRAYLDAERVPRLGRGEFLLAVEGEQRRPPRDDGKQRGDHFVLAHVRLRAESAAGRYVMAFHLVLPQAEGVRDLLGDEPG